MSQYENQVHFPIHDEPTIDLLLNPVYFSPQTIQLNDNKNNNNNNNIKSKIKTRYGIPESIVRGLIQIEVNKFEVVGWGLRIQLGSPIYTL
jgi:hypothetical protein